MNILDYAASVPTPADWTAAFQQAIADLRTRGGGTLIVPAGDYPTGAIRLYDNMTLHIESGAVLRFHQDASAFPLIDLEFEGIAGLAHQPCIYAEHAKNVTITGYGTLDGQGSYWWTRQRAGQNAHPRPYLVCFNHCEHVTLENVTLTNSPAWTVHPLYCRNVVIRGLNIKNPADSPNTDGIDPDGCQDVRIHDCTIDVGDDCIAIKSGTEDTPNRQVCERIIISNCHFLHGHGGVVLGSEMSGGIRRVSITGCVFDGTDRGIRIKSRRGRGGTVEDVSVTGIVMNDVLCPLVINLMYFCGKDGKLPIVSDPNAQPVTERTPHVRRIRMADIVVTNAKSAAACLYGLPEAPLEDISIVNTQIHLTEDAPSFPAMNAVQQPVTLAGLTAEHVRGLHLTDLRIVGARGETVTLHDVE